MLIKRNLKIHQIFRKREIGFRNSKKQTSKHQAKKKKQCTRCQEKIETELSEVLTLFKMLSK